ncbi:ABC transporter permease [Egicoccus sp. AB-alg6-2]|uniref:ABC transporter permease n=1 Tax=Egicoccus sp. AB-alg6-2 TaxID=3242692 RepID=UPI00359DBB52
MSLPSIEKAGELAEIAPLMDGGGAEPARTRRSRLRAWRPTPRDLWIGLLVLLVLWLVMAPMALVVWGSFRDAPPGVEGAYTLLNYLEGYSTPRFMRAVRNSLIFAFSSSILAFVVGCYLAWVTERTNTPFRGLIYAFILLPVVVPGILTTIAWVLLLNPTIGILNQAVQLIPGLGDWAPFNSYGMLPMIWGDGIDSITLPFLLMAAAFRSMDPSLEEASAASGASGFHTFRNITLPILTPAVLATFLLLFIKTIETFETPAIMGLPGGVTVFATEVYIASQRFPRNQNLAAAFAVGYLLLTVGGLMLYNRATRLSERFATVTGKGFKPTRIDLGRRRWLHFTGTMTVLFIAVVLPFLVMLYASFLPYYRVPSMASFQVMSTDNYMRVLTNSRTIRAVNNNLKVGVTSALAAILLSTLISWVVIRTQIRGRKLLDAISFAPIAVPGLVMGLALVWFYLTVPMPVQIYGTLFIIGLGFVAKYIPYGMRATHAGLSQISNELEEASAASGASFPRTFVMIISPLLAGSLLIAFVYILSLTFKVLALPVMLSGTNTELMAVMIFDMYENGDFTGLNALGVVMFFILLTLAGISRLVAGKLGFLETNK